MDAVKNAWVQRVLGFTIRGSGAAPALKPVTLAAAALPAIRYVSVEGRAVWEDARESVLRQFTALQGRLGEANDGDMQAIADHGLGAVQERLGVKMQAAMIDADAAPPDKAEAARAKARQVVAGFRQQLASDKLFQLLDENPLGVPMSIRGTLDGALERIEQVLR